eukprot:scaffold214457_cov23-Prasinocladus_malaysianus.AAC.1
MKNKAAWYGHSYQYITRTVLRPLHNLDPSTNNDVPGLFEIDLHADGLSFLMIPTLVKNNGHPKNTAPLLQFTEIFPLPLNQLLVAGAEAAPTAVPPAVRTVAKPRLKMPTRRARKRANDLLSPFQLNWAKKRKRQPRIPLLPSPSQPAATSVGDTHRPSKRMTRAEAMAARKAPLRWHRPPAASHATLRPLTGDVVLDASHITPNMSLPADLPSSGGLNNALQAAGNNAEEHPASIQRRDASLEPLAAQRCHQPRAMSDDARQPSPAARADMRALSASESIRNAIYRGLASFLSGLGFAMSNPPSPLAAEPKGLYDNKYGDHAKPSA